MKYIYEYESPTCKSQTVIRPGPSVGYIQRAANAISQLSEVMSMTLDMKQQSSKKSYTTEIIVNFQIEGLHNWPDAKKKLPQMGFLSDLHRHMFHFTVKKKVSHDDRDIEIIQFQRKIIDWLDRSFFNRTYNCCHFKNMSCEMLADMIIKDFDCTEVTVLEDGENGACITLNTK